VPNSRLQIIWAVRLCAEFFSVDRWWPPSLKKI
jgi:hypothetical protein